MVLRTIKDVSWQGKKVLLRVDYNLPQDDKGSITDDAKMRASLPTLLYLLDAGAALIILSHLGRPKGKRNEKLTLRPMAEHLATLLEQEVNFCPDCIGEKAEQAVQQLLPGEVLLLENVRFYPEEEQNDPAFAEKIANLGDAFVNDAFATAHRAHASTVGIGRFKTAYAGLLMEEEVMTLEKVMHTIQSPRVAILGGAKITDKLGLINSFMQLMDVIIIGGGMANSFLKAQGYNIGKSLHEESLLEEAAAILEKAEAGKIQILLPVDVVVADALTADAKGKTVKIDAVPADSMIVDIGDETVEKFAASLKKAKAIVWNGPLGVYEYKQFARGTEKIAAVVAALDAVSVIGGGNIAAAIKDLGLSAEITHISTGGGATLEFLEGIDLPGIAVCKED